MSDKTYNGWANYATWRVNLEIFDGSTIEDLFGEPQANVYELGKMLKDYAEQLIEAVSEEGLARDYALAFLSDVNWHEIAEHMIENAEYEVEA